MPLTPGTRLGSCEILAPLGAGGMGEVYRARDMALGREVALKVLPPEFASDPERLRRFTQEAQAAAALNHPNILGIHHVGAEQGAPFIVSELLEGETLRDRLGAGALPVKKAVEYAMQVASGLASAHDKGIVHRDLKPENLFITNDGRMKILDFGLAKLTGADAAALQDRQTVTAGTGAGMVLGTVGYMSPEQVRAQAVDPRTDLFSLGAILYEMVSGRRAFRGETPADTMSAILKEEPEPLTASTTGVPPALERVVRHCLEKNPYERFQSARDLKFDLSEIIATPSGTASSSQVSGIAPVPPATRSSRAIAVATVGGAAMALAAGLGWVAHRAPAAGQPTYQRLTFRRGTIATARFAPDRKTIVYGAAWDGAPPETFLVTTDSPESRTLGVTGSDVYAVSPSSELALSLRPNGSLPPQGATLARAPLLAGAAPREVMNDVEFADWGPNDTMAVTLDTGVGDRLEYPIGTMLYEAPGPIHQIRVAPDGGSVAFWEVVHGASSVVVIDRSRQKRSLSDGWHDVDGLAWTASGRQIWFAGRSSEKGWGIYSVTLSGELRQLLSSPGPISLQDVLPEGRALVSRNTLQTGIRYLPSGGQEKELSWLDGSSLADMSADGQWLLFSEIGAAGGSEGAVYIRRSDGSPAVRLGSGQAAALSPDGKSVLATVRSGQTLQVLPVGVGTVRTLSGQFTGYYSAGWMPDGRVVFVAMEQGHNPRVYVQALGGTPRAMSPEGLAFRPIVSPDGERVATRIDGKFMILSTNGGEPRIVTTIPGNVVPIRWLDADSLLVMSRKANDLTVSRASLSTGALTLVRTITYTDRAGVQNTLGLQVTPDLKSYAFSYARVLSELYIVDGLATDGR